MSSVKYLATPGPFVIHNARVDEMFQQNQGHLTPGKETLIALTHFDLSGSAREGLGEHPPYERLPYPLKVGDRQGKFRFPMLLTPLSSA